MSTNLGGLSLHTKVENLPEIRGLSCRFGLTRHTEACHLAAPAVMEPTHSDRPQHSTAPARRKEGREGEEGGDEKERGEG